jgi:6-pyruvoyltetrahydropterin/6-carboxytetrahydropterin synthase
MEMLVSRKFHFDAAHWLPDYIGKCQHLHGHRWTVEVGIYGEVGQASGMVIDFSVLKEIVQNTIIDKLDHSCLNDILPNPTAENLAIYISNKLRPSIDSLSANFRLTYIKVGETEDSYATLE